VVQAARGSGWLVDALGCDPAALRSLPTLQRLFGSVVRDLDLHPVGDAPFAPLLGRARDLRVKALVIALLLLAEATAWPHARS
jgi:hypothetical protein